MPESEVRVWRKAAGKRGGGLEEECRKAKCGFGGRLPESEVEVWTSARDTVLTGRVNARGSEADSSIQANVVEYQ